MTKIKKEDYFNRICEVEKVAELMVSTVKRIKDDLMASMQDDRFIWKLSLGEVLDADESIRNYPCTAITQACAQSNRVAFADYNELCMEFSRRGWTPKRRQDFNPQPTTEDYNNFKMKVMNVICELYTKKFNSEEYQRITNDAPQAEAESPDFLDVQQTIDEIERLANEQTIIGK